MSTGSSNIIYTKEGDQIVRLAEHSCYCDLCRLMDKIDSKSVELTKKYLSEEWDLETWWDAIMRETNSEDEVALNRFSAHFEHGPVHLKHAIENVVWIEYYPDPWGNRQLATERELRLKLAGVIEGYEIRQRTVREWTKGENPFKKE